MSTKRLPRRERNKIRNREEILEAALEEFSAKGFRDASMQDIAARAEFAIGTVYSLFDSKDELYLELLSNYVEKASVIFHGILEQGDDEYERLINYAVAKGELFRDNPLMARIVVHETTGPSTTFTRGLQPIIKEQYEFWLRRIASEFERGIQNGIFRTYDSYYLAVLLDGMTSIFLYRWLEKPDEHPYEKSLEFIQEVLWNIVLTEEYRERRSAAGKGA